MEVSVAAKLKALENENAKLKCLLADQMLDNVVLKDLLGQPALSIIGEGLVDIDAALFGVFTDNVGLVAPNTSAVPSTCAHIGLP